MPLLSIHETSVAGYGRWDAFMRLYICWRWQGAGYAKLLLFGPICNLTAIQAKNLRKSCKKELLISEIFSIDKKCVFQTQKITEVWVWSACLVSIEKITSKISIFSSDLWEYWAYTGFLNHQCPFIGNCYENSVYVWWDTRVYATSSMKKRHIYQRAGAFLVQDTCADFPGVFRFRGKLSGRRRLPRV